MSGFTKFRAGLTAAGCAAIIFTGATYGAGLKTQEEWTEVGKMHLAHAACILTPRRNDRSSMGRHMTSKLRSWRASESAFFLSVETGRESRRPWRRGYEREKRRNQRADRVGTLPGTRPKLLCDGLEGVFGP